MFSCQAASGVDGVTVTTSSDVQTQELAAKIAENAQLHLRVRAILFIHCSILVQYTCAYTCIYMYMLYNVQVHAVFFFQGGKPIFGEIEGGVGYS